MQNKESEWRWQWNRFFDDNEKLFWDWVYPNGPADFRDKSVLDCGCGGGQHLSFVSPLAREVIGVDLNSLDSAKEHTRHLENITLVEGDIASIDLNRKFDVVYSIGVLHHTVNPAQSFWNICKHCKNGGKVIVWVYSREGNFLNRTVVEGLKSILIKYLPRKVLEMLSHLLTFLIYIPVYTIYLLPVKILPYYEYFKRWRKLSYERNLLNVFDKLNAPRTHFISEKMIREWFNGKDFSNVHVSWHLGVGWRGSGVKNSI